MKKINMQSIGEKMTILSSDYHQKEILLDDKEKNLKIAKAELETIEKSIKIMQEVSSNMQVSIKDKIERIVQSCLDATMPGNVFTMSFVSRRDKTEIDMRVKDSVSGFDHNILYSFGGGLKDIVSYALRMALWSIGNTSPIIILDEPFKFASEQYKDTSAKLISVLSRELGLQFIVVSHVPQIIECSDVAYIVAKDKNGVSRVTKKI